MSNTTVRQALTTVHPGLGAKLPILTIGSMYSVLASLQKIWKTSLNGFVKITIQLRNQTIKEPLKSKIKNNDYKKLKHAKYFEKQTFLTP